VTGPGERAPSSALPPVYNPSSSKPGASTSRQWHFPQRQAATARVGWSSGPLHQPPNPPPRPRSSRRLRGWRVNVDDSNNTNNTDNVDNANKVDNVPVGVLPCRHATGRAANTPQTCQRKLCVAGRGGQGRQRARRRYPVARPRDTPSIATLRKPLSQCLCQFSLAIAARSRHLASPLRQIPRQSLSPPSPIDNSNPPTPPS
jgi:hypothetical protein